MLSSKRWRRTIAQLAIVVAAASTSANAVGAPCWRPPVSAAVADPFREPPCRWCPGNRGLEYRLATPGAVRASASGTVVFAGTVVDIRYVVVELSNRWRHTYGHLTSTHLDVGDRVLAGGLIGRADRRLFFGLRIGDRYADPAPYLASAVGRARLIPVDGTPARPAPPPSLRCSPARSSARASLTSGR